MNWSNLEAEYEGFPLLLRRPDHQDIWKYRKKFPRLVSIEHRLERVKKNGLPESGYNKTLEEFDQYFCNLFDDCDKGIIFLIETFGGKRNNYFFTTTTFNMKHLVNNAIKKYKVDLGFDSSNDKEWNFLKQYPITLFEPLKSRKK